MKTRLSSDIQLARAILVIVTVFLMFYSAAADAQTKRSRCHRALEIFFGVRGYKVESNVEASIVKIEGGSAGVSEKTFYLSRPRKVKKKFIELFKPYSGYTSASGFEFENGDKALYYLTTIDWNFNHGKEVVQLWDIGFRLAENLPNYDKFIKSGFHAKNKNHSGPVYFIKVNINTERSKSFATLTFSEYNGKMLYTLYFSEEPSLDKHLEKLSIKETLAKN